MFMWMLHDKLEKTMKYQNVYVIVTWWTWKDYNRLWVLHFNIEKIVRDQNVYVNVTW
jgi:hypothetical protein